MNRNPEFARDAARFEAEWGIVLPYTMDYLPDKYTPEWNQLAQDAATQPPLVTTANAGVPMMFTSFVDPEVVRIFQAPNMGASILGEEKRGSWTDQTYFIPVVENTGETASYGDYSTNGMSDANEQWEQRQSYLFQTIYQLGDLEVERAGTARLNLVSEKQISVAKTMDKFMDYTYHFGVQGLQNYGLLNDPSLPAALTPSTKAFSGSGVKWVYLGAVTATGAEIYADFQTMFQSLLTSTAGLVDANSNFTLVMPNTVAGAMTAVNTFGITIKMLLSESFPNLTIIVDPRYATVAGNVVQLIVRSFDGKDTGFCAFNEKMREHPIFRDLSSYRQKKTGGTWGAIIKYPVAIAQMIGV